MSAIGSPVVVRFYCVVVLVCYFFVGCSPYGTGSFVVARFYCVVVLACYLYSMLVVVPMVLFLLLLLSVVNLHIFCCRSSDFLNSEVDMHF